MLRSVSLLGTRDVNGYPLQGYDFVPERSQPIPKDTLSDLVKFSQKATRREDALQRDAEY